MPRMKTVKNTLFAVLTVLCLFFGFTVFFSGIWFCRVFGDVGFDSVIFTLTNSLSGSDINTVLQYLYGALAPAIVFTALFSLLLLVPWKKKWLVQGKKKERQFFPFRRGIAALIALALSVGLTLSAVYMTGLGEYIKAQNTEGTIYEKHYVDPATVEITFPEQKQNLVFIVLESIENTFMSQKEGGGLDHDLIPELAAMAKENVSFSHTEGLGGFRNTTGTTWSAGSLISMTAGIHFQVPVGIDLNAYADNFQKVLPGATTLMDILHAEGYRQEYLAGSDTTFGGVKQYFEQHQTDTVYDYYSMRDDGRIPHGYWAWWGVEDKKLMDIAKEEILTLSQGEEPFALYISTMDTHFTDGYFCEDCADTFDEQYDNVISCFSKRMKDFVNWMQEQPFIHNTTIVLVGDHPTMDNRYIQKYTPKDYMRTVYNCFINAKAEPVAPYNRTFASYDIYPTVLAAMGCEIPGNSLGLGTNMFSGKQTLMERLGSFDEVNNQLAQYSDYYARYIAKLSNETAGNEN